MNEPAEVQTRGPLFPASLPVEFQRMAASEDARDLVMWWWLTGWDLPIGAQSLQEVLGFPTSNFVVETTGARFWGPTTRRSTRILEGRGWAIGALLRPAAIPAFTDDPGALRDSFLDIAIGEICEPAGSSLTELSRAARELERWLVDRSGRATEKGVQANRMLEIATSDSTVNSVADLARALEVSERTVHRLAQRYVGLSPYAVIRRRRLQEAVQILRENSGASLAEVADQFGFADQAHLAHEMKSTLGSSATTYREALQTAPPRPGTSHELVS